jgi:predicted nucleotidyltransferase
MEKVGLKQYLRDVLGRDVDVLTQAGLHRLIRRHVV